jgi:hypothetical protein
MPRGRPKKISREISYGSESPAGDFEPHENGSKRFHTAKHIATKRDLRRKVFAALLATDEEPLKEVQESRVFKKRGRPRKDHSALLSIQKSPLESPAQPRCDSVIADKSAGEQAAIVKCTAEMDFARLVSGVCGAEFFGFGVFRTPQGMFLVLNAHNCRINFDANIM